MDYWCQAPQKDKLLVLVFLWCLTPLCFIGIHFLMDYGEFCRNITGNVMIFISFGYKIRLDSKLFYDNLVVTK